MTKTADTAHTKPPVFPIVGIGASAGGLEAFEMFFKACPADIGMAFVLVPHLDPNHVSLLTEILQRNTTMPVHEAVDQIAVSPNCVYIIPPNRDMEIFHGMLQLSEPEKPRGQRMPIDAFLRSLADDQQDNAIGIIFSGTGSDGSLGLRAIHGAGGTTLVQDPASAQYEGMPSSAIKGGHVSQVLLINKMPSALLSCRHADSTNSKTIEGEQERIGINHILLQLRKITGNDFSRYKKSTIGRRIERRMLQHQISDFDTYTRYMKTNSDEAFILFKELLINVTSFFRDAEAFDILKKEILPTLLKNKSNDGVFRIWITGCSTGEEAYSIAIVLHELIEASHQDITVQIFSTDLDDDAITIARAGIYSPNIRQDMTAERMQRFFTKVDAGYKINKNIREMVVFAIQNVIKDPPFTKLDLLSCRNLMIYLEPELQHRLISTFHYALIPNGVLFLSPSESIGTHVELFSPLNRKWKFYASKYSSRPSGFKMSDVTSVSTATKKYNQPEKEIIKQVEKLNLVELNQRVLVQNFAPVSVITDFTGNILYVHGDTGKYLRPALGPASLNVIAMAREGLEIELHAAISAANNEGKTTLNRNIQVKTNGEIITFNLNVRPISDGIEQTKNMLLVSFIDVVSEIAQPKRKRSVKTVDVERIAELEQELLVLRSNYQQITENQQTSNEEMQSTNEELQSTNEEMQSTNEELETSKEELQSVNEELISVNAELQTKIGILNEVQNDIKNLLDSIHVGIIFLDKHLNIRRFTPEATQVYRLVSSDVGRPLSDIKPVNELAYDDLVDSAQTVLSSLIPHERELPIKEGKYIMARIQAYRTLDNFIDGVVFTFTDITLRIQATKSALALANSIVNTVREPLIVLDSTLKVVAASHSFYEQFKVNQKETVGNKIFDLGNKQWNIPALRTLLEDVLLKTLDFDNYEVEHHFPHIGHRKMRLNARRIDSEDNKPALILLSIEVNQ